MPQEFEPVVGLEVHAQLLTETKLFCSCSARFGAPPNTLTCPVCAGHPGTLPVLNERALELAIVAGLAFGCRIARYTKFDRKNYFYPDLPKGYQITQYDLPLCSNGALEVETEGGRKRIGIRRIHLEEDSGKSVHDEATGRTAIDLNRCGTALIEIVSEPDIRSSAEAHAYLVMLRRTLRYLGVSDCEMQEGSLRVDVNIPFTFRMCEGKVICSDTFEGRILNISSGGMFACTLADVEPFFNIRFRLGVGVLGTETNDIFGKILRVNKSDELNEMNVEFTVIDPRDRNAIKDLAVSNIYPGDMLLKNFGVTRLNRVVFYDYESDIADGLESPQVHNDPPAKREQALRMAINLVIYVLTH